MDDSGDYCPKLFINAQLFPIFSSPQAAGKGFSGYGGSELNPTGGFITPVQIIGDTKITELTRGGIWVGGAQNSRGILLCAGKGEVTSLFTLPTVRFTGDHNDSHLLALYIQATRDREEGIIGKLQHSFRRQR